MAMDEREEPWDRRRAIWQDKKVGIAPIATKKAREMHAKNAKQITSDIYMMHLAMISGGIKQRLVVWTGRRLKLKIKVCKSSDRIKQDDMGTSAS